MVCYIPAATTVAVAANAVDVVVKIKSYENAVFMLARDPPNDGMCEILCRLSSSPLPFWEGACQERRA